MLLIFSVCPPGVTLIPSPVEEATFHPQYLKSHVHNFYVLMFRYSGTLTSPSSLHLGLSFSESAFVYRLLPWETSTANAFNLQKKSYYLAEFIFVLEINEGARD